MTASDEDANAGDASTPPWGVLGVGGAVSLCCLFAAPTAGAAVAGGTTATLGGGVVRILVTVLAVGMVGAVYRFRSVGSPAARRTAANPDPYRSALTERRTAPTFRFP
ncbi:hypothetical protein [Halolamina sediminis]|jgi:hypothetical protein|uniref:hypothetical protein n=1 Tax=Halolamina sediminis TaxID=1480675 RepID=UPI001929CDE1|nr:hypothetical protein [Halolamina sediminis]